MKKEMKDMEFVELLEWASKNEDEIADNQWAEYHSIVKQNAREHFRQMNFTQLEQFYTKHSSENTDPWFDAWHDSILSTFPFEGIQESIRVLENSVHLLLKEHDKEPAKITIGQLNKLKHGLQ